MLVPSACATLGGCRDPEFLFNLSKPFSNEGKSQEENSKLQTTDLEITSARDELLKEIYEIERESFSAPYPPYVFASMVEETPETFLVAIFKQNTVGYVLASLRKDAGHILSMAVKEDFRRKGVGSKLMTGILEVLYRKGVRRVDLEVRMSNHIAQEFYRKLGFQEKGLIKEYYRDGEDAVKMSRNFP